MTILIWSCEDKTLHADKMVSGSDSRATTTKIGRLPDKRSYGFYGNLSRCKEIINWLSLKPGAAPYPVLDKDEPDLHGYVVVVCNKKKTLMIYNGNKHPTELDYAQNLFFGSGANYAEAAVHLGRDMLTAVQTANALSPYCGMGVEKLDTVSGKKTIYRV